MSRRGLILMLWASQVTACADDAPAAAASACAAPQPRLGYPLCVETVDSVPPWVAIAQALPMTASPRTGNYLVPARTGARLPPVFQDDRAPLKSHFQFLAQGFPDRFPGLTAAEADALAIDPAGR